MEPDITEKERRIFSTNLTRLMLEDHVNQDDLVKSLGYSSSTVSDWCNAKKYPRIKAMQQLADFFGVSLADLRDQHDAGINANSQAGLKREIDPIYDALNVTGQKELCRYGRYLTGQDEYKADGTAPD